MWHKFSDQTKHVFFRAQDKAGNLGVDEISPEILLAATIDRAFPLGSMVNPTLKLKAIGLVQTLESIAVEQRTQIEPDPLAPIRFNEASKKVLKLAMKQSEEAMHSSVEPQHLLLAILANWESGGAISITVLDKLGDLMDVMIYQFVARERLPRKDTREAVSGDIHKLVRSLGLRLSRNLDFSLIRTAVRGNRVAPPPDNAIAFVLFAILRDRSSAASRLLSSMGCPQDLVLELLDLTEEQLGQFVSADFSKNSDFSQLLQEADALTRGEPISTAHFLLALLERNENSFSKRLGRAGVTAEALRSLMRDNAFAEPSLSADMILNREPAPWRSDDVTICTLLAEAQELGRSVLGKLGVDERTLDYMIRTCEVRLRPNGNESGGTTFELMAHAADLARERNETLSMAHLLFSFFDLKDSRTYQALFLLSLTKENFFDRFGVVSKSQLETMKALLEEISPS